MAIQTPTTLDLAIAADLRAHWDEMQFDAVELACSLLDDLEFGRYEECDAEMEAEMCPDLFERATGISHAQFCDAAETEESEAICDAAMERWLEVVRLASRIWLETHPEATAIAKAEAGLA